MAVAEFGGSLLIKQDFTANVTLSCRKSADRELLIWKLTAGPMISDNQPMLVASSSDFCPLDAMLMEDRTPLIANGVQITPPEIQCKKWACGLY